ncbi:MAG: hypothetical protein ABI640_01975 [Gammaproteobacteria bacterium]
MKTVSWRGAQFAVLGLWLHGCGGGSDPAPSPPTPVPVTLQGTVTFDLVPAVAGRGLDYPQTVERPARGVTVEVVAAGTVLASTATDSAGHYSVTVTPNTEASLRVRAEMVRAGAPSWDFRVVDNVNSDALFTLAGVAFNTGTADLGRDLHAGSGWTGSAYSAPRSAAPFAILDVVYECVQVVLSASPAAVFPPLQMKWSTSNSPVTGPGFGEIGSSRFVAGVGIELLGAAEQDTDEYDRHVIAHEWGHYLERSFSRSDNIGGSHSITDQLDMRVAFSEAWATAFAGIAMHDPIYVDTFGAGQAHNFSFDLEQSPNRRNPNAGWFNEEAVQSLLYDLYDNGRDVAPGTLTLDDLALGFGPLFDVMINAQRQTLALTSVFSFIDALKQVRPADAPLIDQLTMAQGIRPVANEYGTNETNYGVPSKRTPQEVAADFHGVYDTVAVNGPAVNVCSLDDYTSASTGAGNKLASRRFVRFAVTTPGPHVVTARAIAPLNGAADPDLKLHAPDGSLLSSTGPPQCTIDMPQACVESFTPTLAAGEHVLEVYEWTNTNDTSDLYPPIGRTCFDVTVTR